MISNTIIFYIASVMIIFFSLCTLFARNIIYSLLCSIMVFLLGAIFFYILGSEYNAIVQAAVYGLAVPVIIGMTIMFTTGNKEKESNTNISYLTIISAGIFVLAFVYIIMMALVINPNTFNVVDSLHINSYENISAFAKGIFVRYVWGFELLSLLLTIVIAGLTMFKNEKRRIESEK